MISRRRTWVDPSPQGSGRSEGERDGHHYNQRGHRCKRSYRRRLRRPAHHVDLRTSDNPRNCLPRCTLGGILISGMGSLVMFLVFRVSFGHEVAGFLAFVLATTCLAMLISMIIAWRRAHQPNPGQEIGHSG